MSNIPNKVEKAINEFVIAINNILNDNRNKIILYGSYARGDYKKNSDIDIIILTNLSEKQIVNIRTKIWDIAYDIGLKYDIIISALIKNINEFNYWSDTLPFYMNVNREGVILNG